MAREIADEEAFYFPHSLDFRGRAYPMHPHLNHLGNDLCRGVLSFAEARPLGRNGLGWLYVQVCGEWLAACKVCLAAACQTVADEFRILDSMCFASVWVICEQTDAAS